MGYRECQPAVLRIPSLALIGALKWSKILAALKSRGKNFGRVFFDVFLGPEFDPVVGFVKYQPNRALPHLMTLVVRDCTGSGNVRLRLMEGTQFLWAQMPGLLPGIDLMPQVLNAP